MGDTGKNLATQKQPLSTPGGDGSSPFKRFFAMGAAVVVVIVAAVFLFGHKKPDINANKSDPYTTKLKLYELHVSTAENFAGSPVIYIEGKIMNTGDKKVTGARAELIFKNSIGDTFPQEFIPVTVALPNVPYAGYDSLDHAPLAPGQTRDFRLTLEQVAADWNREIPEVKVLTVTY